MRVAEDAIVRFRTASTASLPLAAMLVDDLASEARPAVQALLFATSTPRAENPESLEHHETLAMFTLLGRRVAVLGGTPTAALRLVSMLLAAIRECEWPVPFYLDETLSTVAMEGYVRGREERILGEAARQAVGRIPMVSLAEGCIAVLPRGAYDSEHLAAAMEELGRRMFREDMRACLVVLDGLEDVTAATARALLSVHEYARTLGVTAVFAGMDSRFAEAADRAGVDRSRLTLAPDAVSGVRRALSNAGYALRRIDWLPAPIREWFARGR